MSFDSAAHYDPIYDAIGVAATITPASTGIPKTVTAIDKTAGVAVDLGQGDLSVQTTRPAAALRMSEVLANGWTRDDLRKGLIALNGKTWRIESSSPRPSPQGESSGELYVFLQDIEP